MFSGRSTSNATMSEIAPLFNSSEASDMKRPQDGAFAGLLRRHVAAVLSLNDKRKPDGDRFREWKH